MDGKTAWESTIPGAENGVLYSGNDVTEKEPSSGFIFAGRK
jgi:hypothetical protein